mgnify:FL=1
MKFFDFIKGFFIFTIKEIYSFFLKLILVIGVLAIITIVLVSSAKNFTEQKEGISKNYSYVILNPYNPTEDKINNKLFSNSKYNMNFHELVTSVDYIAKDPKIKGVIINLDQVDRKSVV